MIPTVEQVTKALEAFPGYELATGGRTLRSYKYDPAAAALGFADQSSELTNEQIEMVDNFWMRVSLVANNGKPAGEYLQYTMYPEEVLTAALLELEKQGGQPKKQQRRRRRS